MDRSELDCDCPTCLAETKPLKWLIYKYEYNLWYRPKSRGYTDLSFIAGRYSEECAKRHARTDRGKTLGTYKEGTKEFDDKRLSLNYDAENYVAKLHDHIEALELE